jgi:hypothetical protein
MVEAMALGSVLGLAGCAYDDIDHLYVILGRRARAGGSAFRPSAYMDHQDTEEGSASPPSPSDPRGRRRVVAPPFAGWW